MFYNKVQQNCIVYYMYQLCDYFNKMEEKIMSKRKLYRKLGALTSAMTVLACPVSNFRSAAMENLEKNLKKNMEHYENNKIEIGELLAIHIHDEALKNVKNAISLENIWMRLNHMLKNWLN